MPATQYSYSYTHDPVGFLTDRIGSVNTAEELEALLRTDYRSVIPYRMALCGLGEVDGGLIYKLINVDTPNDYVSVVVRKQAKGTVLNCPEMREWLKKRETLFVAEPGLLDPANKEWVAALERHNIRDTVIGGISDISGKITSAFCFIGIPSQGRDSYLKLIDLTIAALHRALISSYKKSLDLENSTNDLRITRRETEILRWLYQGLGNEGIASKAEISVNTVRSHIRNIILKMGVSNRTQVLAKALREGLIRG